MPANLHENKLITLQRIAWLLNQSILIFKTVFFISLKNILAFTNSSVPSGWTLPLADEMSFPNNYSPDNSKGYSFSKESFNNIFRETRRASTKEAPVNYTGVDEVTVRWSKMLESAFAAKKERNA